MFAKYHELRGSVIGGQDRFGLALASAADAELAAKDVARATATAVPIKELFRFCMRFPL